MRDLSRIDFPRLSDNLGMVSPLHNTKISFSAVSIALALSLGLSGAAVTHKWVARVDLPKPYGPGGGTMYLNKILEQPSTFDGLEFDPSIDDTGFSEFGKQLASRVRSLMLHGSERYDAFFIGFYPGMGWPFQSKAPYVEVFIDEYGSDGRRIIDQHHFVAGPDGAYPLDFLRFCANSFVFALVFLPISMFFVSRVRAYYIRRSQLRRGFPVITEHIDIS